MFYVYILASRRNATRENAFLRERRVKKWNRAWKIAIIERANPGWRDLFNEWFS